VVLTPLIMLLLAAQIIVSGINNRWKKYGKSVRLSR
jgi:hypothetical protein